MRLNIPAGLAVRFEPGDTREVELVVLGGLGRAVGFNNLATARRPPRPACARRCGWCASRGLSKSS
jgi:hypothetical protein